MKGVDDFLRVVTFRGNALQIASFHWPALLEIFGGSTPGVSISSTRADAKPLQLPRHAGPILGFCGGPAQERVDDRRFAGVWDADDHRARRAGSRLWSGTRDRCGDARDAALRARVDAEALPSDSVKCFSHRLVVA